MKSFYFYKSSDKGKTWSFVSELDPSAFSGLSRDKMGMPGLYVLQEQVADLPAGTILFATSDWDVNAQYCIHIWRSDDNGKTWIHHSDLAPRGDTTSGTGSVWEPEFSIAADGRLVCYYSDERQPGYDQCLALEISDDGGRTWSNYKIITGKYVEGWRRGIDPTQWRPGMPRVLRLKDGTYFMTFENIADGYNGIVSCKTSKDGIEWGDILSIGQRVTADGMAAFQCPEVGYIDDGSQYGNLFIRGMNDNCTTNQCFMSDDKGATWQIVESPLTAFRQETMGSGWSGTFIGSEDKLIELNNYFNGSYNEIRCGNATLYGDRLIVDGAPYKLINSASALCLDNAGGSKNWGNEMILWEENELPTESWYFIANGNGVTLVNHFSDLALDVPNGSETPGLKIVQWDKNYSAAQRFMLEQQGDGSFKLKNDASKLYLDTENGGISLHTKIVQNIQSNQLTQRWLIKRSDDIVRLHSYNINDSYVYHDGNNRALIANRNTQMPWSSSQWKIVPGLADASCISFESTDMPGYYLRHYNGQLIIAKNDGSALFSQDATWRRRKGFIGNGTVSLESYNIAGNFMRHYESYLRISTIGSDIEKADASFYLDR